MSQVDHEPGLLPRAVHRRSNWRHTVESNRHAVYLTNTYALYYAIQAGDNANAGRIAILEIDIDQLEYFQLVPDEDALAAVGRGNDQLPADWTLRQRTRHYRDRLKHYAGKYDVSLDATGTCSYLGTIPATSITMVAFIDYKAAAGPCFIASDAQVSIQNFNLKGASHRAVINWIFNDRLPELTGFDKIMCDDTVQLLKKTEWVGVEIVKP